MIGQDHKQAFPRRFGLGSYRVARARRGGFGITYPGEHAGLGVQVAVKEYLPNEIAPRAQRHVQYQRTTRSRASSHSADSSRGDARRPAWTRHPCVVLEIDSIEARQHRLP